MSEKGQGEGTTESATGTGVGVDGTPAGGGGGTQADHGGPTDTVSGWDKYPGGEMDADEYRELLGRAKAAAATENPMDKTDLGGVKPSDFEPPPSPEDSPSAEPEIPGGGPEDQRYDIEHEFGSPLGDLPRGDPLPGSETPRQPTELELRAAPGDRPPGLSNEEFEQWKKDHPTMLDKANTQTDVT